MSEMDRDPRVDPRPGDIIRSQLFGEHEVSAYDGSDTHGIVTVASGKWTSLPMWRSFFHNAEIIKHGDAP